MNAGEALGSAVHSLRAHTLRSVLTAFGIVVGVTSVVVLAGLGAGIKAGFARTFGELATAIIVQPIQGVVPGGGRALELKDGDIDALNDPVRAPSVRRAIPLLSGLAIVRRPGTGLNFPADVAGSTPDFLRVNNRELVVGRMFSEEQAQADARVVLLAPEAVRQLYDGDDAAAVGSTVRINRASFQVVGTLKSDGHFDKIALMPLGTARAYLLGGHDTITSMAAKAIDVARVGPAVDEITTVLDKRHHIRDPAKRDFTVTALRDTLTKVDQTLNYLTLFIASIAGISLLVGGVGVANIMLVSVTERTREIGIRKALGAPRSAIVKQFLIESTTLTCVGGVLGCALGVGLILIGAAVVNRMMPEFGSPSVPVPALLVALGASLLIGLVAGGYPALRAARLRPIEALRHE